MADLKNLLDVYFEAVEVGKFPDYGTIKSMLRALKSARDDKALYDELKNSYKDSCQLLDQVIKAHGTLANKQIRDPIEETRRKDMKNNPDWYQHDPINPSKDEIRTTELISAVEVAHFLLVKVGCDHKEFKNLLGFEAEEVFGLSKLISPFTNDFKILEIYLKFADKTKSKELLNQMIDYLPFINSKGNLQEKKSFKKLILDNLDYEKAVLKINYVLETFKEDFSMIGNLKTLFRCMNLAGLVCGNLNYLEKKTNTEAFAAPRFAKDVSGQPLILHMITGSVDRGVKGKKNQNIGPSNDKAFENSKIALELSVPILEYVVDAGLLSGFARLRSHVDFILANKDENVNEFMASFKKESPASYDELIKLLNRIRDLDDSKQITPAELVASKESKHDENPPKPSKYERPSGSTTKPAATTRFCILI